jgi:salicylate hydroxylase
VVREHLFPDHAIAFTGRTIWRVIIPRKLIADIPEMTTSTAWWHGPAGHFYNCLVDSPEEKPKDDQFWEIAVHNVNPSLINTEKRFSWGIPATNERVESHFTDYDPRVIEALSRVPKGLWKEFSSFSGPRLQQIFGWEKVALIGDASHPLTGS